MRVFRGIDELNISNEDIVDEYTGDPEDVWNKIFESIKAQKGMIWITVVEPHVRTLCATYDIPLPEVLYSLIQSAELENLRLLEMTQSLEQTIKSVNEKLIKCSVTGLYNETFFKSLLMEELENEDWRDVGAFASIGIDNFSKYKLTFGVEEEHNVLNNIAYILKEQFGTNAVYRLESTDFGLYIKGLKKSALIEKIEKLRIGISKSELFLGAVTVSIGVVFPEEIELDAATYDLTVQHYMELSLNRLRIAKMKGKNYFCHSGHDVEEGSGSNKVLVVDHDETNLEVVSTFISDLGIEVLVARDGYQALEMAELHLPKLIISEVNLPKLDGFLLREELRSNSKTKDIELLYLSYQKDEDSVNRAIGLGVMHYLKKPYLLSELIGIVKRNVKGLS